MQNFLPFIERRRALCTRIAARYPEKKGVLCLIGGFEPERGSFRQESSFYYLTGLTEPGIVVGVDLATQKNILFIPSYVVARSQWMDTAFFDFVCNNPSFAGFQEVRFLGAPVSGYTIHPFSEQVHYQSFKQWLYEIVAHKTTIFTLLPESTTSYKDQRIVWMRLCTIVEGLQSVLVDVHDHVASMRRTKDQYEMEKIQEAIATTIAVHECVAPFIRPGVNEAAIHARICGTMRVTGATEAFPSIVGSGKNSTVLHYHANNTIMHPSDLVVVDIGAEKEMYCADITRTYPISGKFTARQKEIYNLVLEAQQYVASLAKPGMWLKNPDMPEKSLHHLAQKFFKQKGVDRYFPHSIGHYVGLDVHDVGSYSEPLKEGDLFTIEPGLYIPRELIGIRIEDNYLMTDESAFCLTQLLVKHAEDIEYLMRKGELY